MPLDDPHFISTKRYASDVGPCQACGYPSDVIPKGAKYPEHATVNVVGLWMTSSHAVEWRLCTVCTSQLSISLNKCGTQMPTHTDSLGGTSRPDKPQTAKERRAATKATGAIAQRAEAKPAPSFTRAALNSTSPVLTAKPKRKPRKYAAKVPAQKGETS